VPLDTRGPLKHHERRGAPTPVGWFWHAVPTYGSLDHSIDLLNQLGPILSINHEMRVFNNHAIYQLTL